MEDTTNPAPFLALAAQLQRAVGGVANKPAFTGQHSSTSLSFPALEVMVEAQARHLITQVQAKKTDELAAKLALKDAILSAVSPELRRQWTIQESTLLPQLAREPWLPEASPDGAAAATPFPKGTPLRPVARQLLQTPPSRGSSSLAREGGAEAAACLLPATLATFLQVCHDKYEEAGHRLAMDLQQRVENWHEEPGIDALAFTLQGLRAELERVIAANAPISGSVRELLRAVRTKLEGAVDSAFLDDDDWRRRARNDLFDRAEPIASSITITVSDIDAFLGEVQAVLLPAYTKFLRSNRTHAERRYALDAQKRVHQALLPGARVPQDLRDLIRPISFKDGKQGYARLMGDIERILQKDNSPNGQEAARARIAAAAAENEAERTGAGGGVQRGQRRQLPDDVYRLLTAARLPKPAFGLLLRDVREAYFSTPTPPPLTTIQALVDAARRQQPLAQPQVATVLRQPPAQAGAPALTEEDALEVERELTRSLGGAQTTAFMVQAPGGQSAAAAASAPAAPQPSPLAAVTTRSASLGKPRYSSPPPMRPAKERRAPAGQKPKGKRVSWAQESCVSSNQEKMPLSFLVDQLH